MIPSCIRSKKSRRSHNKNQNFQKKQIITKKSILSRLWPSLACFLEEQNIQQRLILVISLTSGAELTGFTTQV